MPWNVKAILNKRALKNGIDMKSVTYIVKEIGKGINQSIERYSPLIVNQPKSIIISQLRQGLLKYVNNRSCDRADPVGQKML